VTGTTINFVGDLALLADGVYVDDPALNTIKAGIEGGDRFRLQARYADLKVKEIPLDKGAVEARFVTYYVDPSKRNEVAPGELLVTLNTNATSADAAKDAIALIGQASFTDQIGFFFVNGKEYTIADLGLSSVNFMRAGKLTAMHYIPKVYHVQQVEVIGTTPDLDPKTGLFMYYWGR